MDFEDAMKLAEMMFNAGFESGKTLGWIEARAYFDEHNEFNELINLVLTQQLAKENSG